MEPRRVLAIGLQGPDHAGERAAFAGCILKELLDGGVETLAQQAEEFAVVLEAQAKHLRNRNHVLADREIAQDLLVHVLGKEQGALLVA